MRDRLTNTLGDVVITRCVLGSTAVIVGLDPGTINFGKR